MAESWAGARVRSRGPVPLRIRVGLCASASVWTGARVGRRGPVRLCVLRRECDFSHTRSVGFFEEPFFWMLIFRVMCGCVSLIPVVGQ